MPPEVVMEITSHCDIKSAATLARTCRDFNSIATSILYRKEPMRPLGGFRDISLYWGIKFHSAATVKHALAAGMPANRSSFDYFRRISQYLKFEPVTTERDTQRQHETAEFRTLELECLRQTPLFLACAVGNVEAAKLLLDSGARTDVESGSIAHSCKGHCHYERIVGFLQDYWGVQSLSGDTEIPGKCRYPMDAAICSGNTELAKLIAAHQGTSGTGLHTGLHTAAATTSVEMVNILLSHGACPNARTHLNQTPLHCAVSRREHDDNTLQIIERLVRAGARIDALCINQASLGPVASRTSPVGLTDAQYEEAEASRLQQEAGRIPLPFREGEHRHIRSFTPLGLALAMEAAMEAIIERAMSGRSAGAQHLPMIKLLLSLGANVNGRGARYDGRSVLIWQELRRWGSVQKQGNTKYVDGEESE
ncbi:ankyrin repeat-containing domain protein [Lasiosphaeris hirsuta]|uniref:Ankyrin repeat-containing domain protein n=1 Tax=Lasiosphaeris hirsuta TaxID=260670 RepID=A0AA40BB36_9PEZI|nr:ankyrin repeat-containing domain protein [Lasiosphaeris hirsuta]